MKRRITTYALAALLAAALPGHAREPGHPADPAAAVAPAKYESVFSDYQPFREEKLAPWREVNDEVARVGGHIGVLRAGERQPRQHEHQPAKGGGK